MSGNIDSEMEEGEIVEGVDDLSDISSEEEFLLRQRLEVLESYNSVLERKKAKQSCDKQDARNKKVHAPLTDLSEISLSDLEDISCKHLKRNKNSKQSYKHKRMNLVKKNSKGRVYKKRVNHNKKEELVISETSDESEDEYRCKRIKLANAVNVNGDKIDKSSLSDRLKKMFCSSINNPNICPISPITTNNDNMTIEQKGTTASEEVIKNLTNLTEFIDLCSDNHMEIGDNNQNVSHKFSLIDFNKNNQSVNKGENVVDSINKNEKENVNTKVSVVEDSDDDLELLRQNVLKTKVNKTELHQSDPPKINNNKNLSDDDDSDIDVLRLICLRSSLLKKAYEIKQKQKLQKRLSQSSITQDGILDDPNICSSINELKNSTDTESVDMDMCSDEDGKINEVQNIFTVENNLNKNVATHKQNNEKQYLPKGEEFDEDEDLLRTKLLMSLSKNLPNLIGPTVDETIKNLSLDKAKGPTNKQNKATEEKKFIIELGGSDSECEHEATKNLRKMHMTLSEQIDFEQKLDMLLKSTRMKVETSDPDLKNEVQTPRKFVAKAVNNLPKTEQIEYRNLVKRMAELEKIKQARQSSINIANKASLQDKTTLNQRIVSMDSRTINNNIEQKITSSRKKIAEESAKMLKLKEEAKKLSQKYKIVATELRNITTAITLNKKQQRSVQNYLTKIRQQHQNLLKSSSSLKHSKINGHPSQLNLCSKMLSITKIQKENDPSKDGSINTNGARIVKVSESKEKNDVNPRLSIQVNFATNNNDVTIKSPVKQKVIDLNKLIYKSQIKDAVINLNTESSPVQDKKAEEKIDNNLKDLNEVNINFNDKEKHKFPNENITVCNYKNKRYRYLEDYQSPLQAFKNTNWEADPNAILCPFELGGECRDTECKYLHTNITK